MNNFINISGTSFLLPKNKAWNILGNDNKIAFAGYGDLINSILKCKKNHYLALIIFVSDIYNLSAETKKFDKSNFNFIKFFLKAIEQRLSKTSSPTIITISSWRQDSLIRNAGKNIAYYEKIFNQIVLGLKKIQSSFSNLYIFNLDSQLSEEGMSKAFDNRNWYLAHCRLSIHGIGVLAKSLSKIIDRIESPAKKVLVLDCDNTLWGGVIGEDRLSGIVLGQDGVGNAFSDFQYVIKKLGLEGIILALCSKNNEEDVWQVFSKHNSMILKKKDITAYKINWNEKVKNLIELASDLNVDINSFVFWDDNPIERDRVKKMLPQILTVEPSEDVTEWASHLNGMDCFAKFDITAEDKKKTKQYQMRAKFSKDVEKKIDDISFLKSIKLKAKAVSVNPSTVKRASQISMKTNQFNLRTVRYTEREIAGKNSKNENSFLVNLNDIYGDHGLVGLVSTKKINSKFIFLENLLMSCRVLGRHLEAWMMSEIIKNAKKSNYEYIIAEFIPTKKNIIAKKYLEEHGFLKYNQFKDKQIKNINLKKFTQRGKIYIASIKKIKIPFLEIYDKNL